MVSRRDQFSASHNSHISIASMELEPEQDQKTTDEDTPSLSSYYDGGVWHVEGRLGERIMAAACCCLECTNVQGGKLGFRSIVQEPTGQLGKSNHIGKTYYLFCFFLVDSTVHIRSTTTVPPQQEDLVVQAQTQAQEAVLDPSSSL